MCSHVSITLLVASDVCPHGSRSSSFMSLVYLISMFAFHTDIQLKLAAS